MCLCLASPHWHRPSDCPWMPGWFPQPAVTNKKKKRGGQTKREGHFKNLVCNSLRSYNSPSQSPLRYLWSLICKRPGTQRGCWSDGSGEEKHGMHQNHTAWSILDKPAMINYAMLSTPAIYKLNIFKLDVRMKPGIQMHILCPLLLDLLH